MNHFILERAGAFLQMYRKEKIWKRTLRSLAAVVVFVTAYMLILPAVTMEGSTGDFSDGEIFSDEPGSEAAGFTCSDISEAAEVFAADSETARQSDYELPETGGVGTELYTLGGLLLLALSTLLLYKKRRIKKEGK